MKCQARCFVDYAIDVAEIIALAAILILIAIIIGSPCLVWFILIWAALAVAKATETYMAYLRTCRRIMANPKI